MENRFCVKSLRRFLLVLSSLLLWTHVTANAQASSKRFRVVSYNVENLFDTCHDVGFNDYEFLPTAKRRWNTQCYRAKLARISKVIAAIGDGVPAELVGLCEVENDTVVRDLVERTRLAHLGYRFVMTHSRDPRGIDVALLYQPTRFRLLSSTSYVVPVSPVTGHPTRDLLHVAGQLTTGDTLDVFVCHLPSRLGKRESYRFAVARRLRTLADSVRRTRKNGKVVMLGDFNDEYHDFSIAQGIGAVTATNAEKLSSGEKDEWVVLSAELKETNGVAGTYKYQGEWNELDQIIVSCSLLDTSASFHTTAAACHVFAPPFLLEADTAHKGVRPRRTFIGATYKGGFSDHLPLFVDFEMR